MDRRSRRSGCGGTRAHRLSVGPRAVRPRKSPDCDLRCRCVMSVVEVAASLQRGLRTLKEAERTTTGIRSICHDRHEQGSISPLVVRAGPGRRTDGHEPLDKIGVHRCPVVGLARFNVSAHGLLTAEPVKGVLYLLSTHREADDAIHFLDAEMSAEYGMLSATDTYRAKSARVTPAPL